MILQVVMRFTRWAPYDRYKWIQMEFYIHPVWNFHGGVIALRNVGYRNFSYMFIYALTLWIGGHVFLQEQVLSKREKGCLDVVAATRMISDLTYGLNNRNHVHIWKNIKYTYIYICWCFICSRYSIKILWISCSIVINIRTLFITECNFGLYRRKQSKA